MGQHFQREGITVAEFWGLWMAGHVVDGRAGGFLMGRSHAEGGIMTIQRTGDESFGIRNEFEGCEYLLNHTAGQAAKGRLDEINAYKHEGETIGLLAPSVTRNSRLINTRASPHDKLLWIDARGQFIVNRTATWKFFTELEAINEAHNGFNAFNLDDYI